MPVYPKDVIAAAQAAQAKWGVPASITLAQWAIESGYGKHMPHGSHNPFGIKAKADQPFVAARTKEVIKGKWISVIAKFARYKDIAEAFDAHAKLLATNPHYAGAMKAREQGADVMARHLLAYATDPTYPAKLIRTMAKDDLHQYDEATA